MKPLLDHIGVALLGHEGFKFTGISPVFQTTWRTYRNDQRRFPDLVRNQNLHSWLSENELVIPDDLIGHATLHALACMKGLAVPATLNLTLTAPYVREQLLSRLKGSFRIFIVQS